MTFQRCTCCFPPLYLRNISARYSITKPHILNLQERGDSGGVLNLEHFNLGPHEMAAWAPVFLAADVSELRLSHNRVGAESISAFLPAVGGLRHGGVGDGVVKL